MTRLFFRDFNSISLLFLKPFLKSVSYRNSSFGFLFDIDGVFIRGRSVLPESRAAFRLLIDKHGNWRVPAVFVTNAGNTLTERKAETLSEMFKIKIHTEQIVLAYSPLSLFTHFHDKYVLCVGQGPIKDIASNLGFKSILTINDMKKYYPFLDAADHGRPIPAPCAFEKYNKRVEAVVLFCEPLNWETNLQLLLDILLSNGHPYRRPEDDDPRFPARSTIQRNLPVRPHLPVLVCNLDLLWMAEAPLPRLAHGGFLLALETIYEKLTGQRLLYTTLVGKPSEITYHHATNKLNEFATQFCGYSQLIKQIYCVGDNPQTDIYGANLYNLVLETRRAFSIVNQSESFSAARSQAPSTRPPSLSETPIPSLSGTCSSGMSRPNRSAAAAFHVNAVPLSSMVQRAAYVGPFAETCESILVLTGVYQDHHTKEINQQVDRLNVAYNDINHNHRDFPDYPELRVPNYIASNIEDAIKYVYSKHNYQVEDEGTEISE